jgi:hypothetical protein
MAETPQADRTLTINEAAKYFKKSPRHIQRMCKNGTFLAANCRVEKNFYGAWRIFLPANS